jgi:hypothetical protein
MASEVDVKREEELKVDFLEKLYKILNDWAYNPKRPRTSTIHIASSSGPTPVHQTTDEEVFIKLMLEKYMDYYRQWKTGSSSDPAIKAFTEKLKVSSPKETKDKTNAELLLADLSSPKETKDKAKAKLLLENLLKLSDTRIAHLEKLLGEKIDLIKSI